MILVDDRAGSDTLIPLLGDLVIPFHGEGSTADVIIPGNGPAGEILIGIEVKTIGDLLSSENSGRLAGTQLPALLESYKEVWLVAIGEYRPGVHGRLEVRRRKGWTAYRMGGRSAPYSYVESFLIELSVIGVHVRVLPDYRTAACWIICLHNWWQKPWDKHHAMRKFDASGEGRGLMPDQLTPNQKIIAEMVSRIPGFGFERGVAAAMVFDSPRHMTQGMMEEWLKVPGVGKVLAKVAMEVCRGR